MGIPVVRSRARRVSATKPATQGVPWSLVIGRAAVALWAALQVLTYRELPYPPRVQAFGFGLAALLATGTIAIGVANQRHWARPRLPFAGLVLDAVVVSGFVWAFTFDNLSAHWVILILVSIEAAVVLGLRGGMAVWAIVALSYALRELWGAAEFGHLLDPVSIAFRMGVAAVAALISGSLADQLRRQRGAAEAARDGFVDLLDNLDAIVWEADPASGRVTFVNQRAEVVLGYPLSQWSESPTFRADHLHLDDRAAARICRDAAARGVDHDLTYRMVAADGRVVWFHDVVRVERDDAGQPVRLRGVMVDVSAQHEAAAAVAASEAQLRAIIDAGASGTAVVDSAGHYLMVNRRLCEMTGYGEHELLERSFWDITHPDDVPYGRDVMQLLVDGRAPMIQDEKRYVRSDGRVIWVLLSTAPIESHGLGERDRFVVHVQDITEMKATAAALDHAEASFTQAFAHAPIGMAVADLDGRFSEVNPAFCSMLGYTREQMIGRSFIDITHPDDLEASRRLFQRIVAGELASYQFDKRYVRADGSLCWARLSVAVVRGADGRPATLIGQVADITAQKRAEARLEHLALHDSLTGLGNRLLVMDRLSHGLARLSRQDGKLAVLLLDLDGFKSVNDRLGHEPGDRVLMEVADRIQASIRPSDCSGRIGGDEFVVVCEDLTDAGEADGLARRLEEELSRPYEVDGNVVHLGVSVGVAITDRAAAYPEALLRAADSAMYEVKRQRQPQPHHQVVDIAAS